MGCSRVDDDVVSSLQHTWQHASSPTLGTAEMGMETDTATIRVSELPESRMWDTYMQSLASSYHPYQTLYRTKIYYYYYYYYASIKSIGNRSNITCRKLAYISGEIFWLVSVAYVHTYVHNYTEHCDEQHSTIYWHNHVHACIHTYIPPVVSLLLLLTVVHRQSPPESTWLAAPNDRGVLPLPF